MLTLLLLLWAFGAVASGGGAHGDRSELSASGVLPREKWGVRVGGFFFLTPGGAERGQGGHKSDKADDTGLQWKQYI